jgi:predicted TIM-barrel fold metal-dependent hydrolase
MVGASIEDTISVMQLITHGVPSRDRLLLGTDFPYEAGDVFVRAVDYITDPRITHSEASAILESNATALFGIATPANAATP